MTRFHATVNGQVPFTPEEEAEWNAREAKAKQAVGPDPQKVYEVRAQRNQLLEACDWRALTDQTLTPEWRDYRQALRDITDQPGFPDEVVWPTI